MNPGVSNGPSSPPTRPTTRVQRNGPSRLVVGRTAGRLRRAELVPRLRELGCPSGRALRVRELPLAGLLAGALGGLEARLVRARKAALLAVVPLVHACDARARRPRWVPSHLLLLPRLL